MDLDSMQLGIRYSDAVIATRSYVTLYIITRRLSMCLRSSGRQCRFSSIWLHLRFACSHNRPTGQPFIGLTQFCMCLQQCVKTNSGGIFQLRFN